jgi:hypothetical protein
MSLRSKPLLDPHYQMPPSTLRHAARRASRPHRLRVLYMSLRSKPALAVSTWKRSSALRLAARRSGLPTPSRENRACWGPRSRRLSALIYVASLQTALAVSNQCSFALQTAQARVPVPHFLDALGQTHNYFTSRAHAVMDRLAHCPHCRYQCPVISRATCGPSGRHSSPR